MYLLSVVMSESTMPLSSDTSLQWLNLLLPSPKTMTASTSHRIRASLSVSTHNLGLEYLTACSQTGSSRSLQNHKLVFPTSVCLLIETPLQSCSIQPSTAIKTSIFVLSLLLHQSLSFRVSQLTRPYVSDLTASCVSWKLLLQTPGNK